MAKKLTVTQIHRIIESHMSDYLGVARLKLDADTKLDPNNPDSVELRDTLWAIKRDLGIEADELDFADVNDLGELRVKVIEFLQGVKAETPQAGYGTLEWAVQTLARFEYSSDGFVKRYPEEADYEKAMKIIKVAQNVLSQRKES